MCNNLPMQISFYLRMKFFEEVSLILTIIIKLSPNKMLWKRNLSIYSSPTNKNASQIKRQSTKTKGLLTPIVSAPITTSHQTINPTCTSLPKFMVRKKSKTSKPIHEIVPHTFFLYKGNNSQLVKSVLQSMGYVESANKETCCLVWYQSKELLKKDLQRRDINPRAINYFPNHSEITNKQKLFENLTKYNPQCVGDFIPKTYVIDFKDSLLHIQYILVQFLAEHFRKNGIPKSNKKTNSFCISNYYGQICILFSRVIKHMSESRKAEGYQAGRPHLWIAKPSFLNRGKGIEVIGSLKQLQRFLSEDSQQISVRMYQSEEKNIPNCYVIQEYIMNPLLYLGYKFDLRVWLLLRKSKKNGMEVYIYEKGYARIAGHKYNIETNLEQESEQKLTEAKSSQFSSMKGKRASKNSSLADPYIHLTNNAVQKNCKQYGDLHEGNQLLIEDLISFLKIEQLSKKYLFHEFTRIAKVLIQSAKQKLLLKAAYDTFQLIGLDFMVDSNLKVWLIEANCNPCLEESSTILKNILPAMLRQLLEIVKIKKIMSSKPNPKSSLSSNSLVQEMERQNQEENWAQIM